MKIIFLLLPLIFFSQNTFKKEYFNKEKTKIKFIKTYENNVLISESKYYQNGKIEGLYNLNGNCALYYANGNIKKQFINVNDVPEGLSKEFFSNGNIKGSAYYKNGNFVNEAFTYYENGNTESENLYNEKSLNIYRKSFYENGKIKNILKNIKGYDFNYSEFDENENLIYEVLFIYDIKNDNFFRNGIEKKFFKNGKLKEFSEFETYRLGANNKERKVGNVVHYFYDGNISMKGQYKNDFSVGTWFYYNEDGSVDETFEFLNENPESQYDEEFFNFTSYYNSGKIYKVCEYRSKRNITCLCYDEKENLLNCDE